MHHWVLGAALVLAAPATAFTAQNGLRVEATGASEFEVPWYGRSAALAFWCAAGDYAIRKLHVSPATRIYRYSPPPRPAGEGIRFGLDPARAAANGMFRLQGGMGMPAAHARIMCNATSQRR